MIKKILKILYTVVFMGILIGLIYFVFNYKMYIVATGSMTPTITPGTLIVVDIKETTYEVGDIITFDDNLNTVPVTHRIVEITDDGYYITKGDNNNVEDESSLTIDNIIGKVVYTSVFLGNIVSNYTFVLWIIIIVMVLILLLDVIRSIIRKVRS